VFGIFVYIYISKGVGGEATKLQLLNKNTMGNIINFNILKDFFTNNSYEKLDVNSKPFLEHTPVKYRWTHGATDYHMGDGVLIYAAIQYLRAKVCVCLGSGGGFIPRIMSQARMELHDQEIFEGRKLMEWGDIGTTILVDAINGVGGEVDWNEDDSFFRKHFPCRLILESTESAFYHYFVKEDIKIDYLHIDAGHSYESVKQDFELYSSILSPNGIISIHDTDLSFQKELIVTSDVKSENNFDDFSHGPSKLIREIKESGEWEVFNFFNNGILRTKPASTGLTFIQKCKK